MGACCSGKGGNSKLEKIFKLKDTKVDNQTTSNNLLNNSTSHIKKLENTPNYNGTPVFTLYLEESAIAKNMNYILGKFLLDEKNCLIENPNLKIRKINIEELWNITKFYKYDHTKSNHLICDFRNQTNKTQNFLKFFRSLNYNLENFQTLDETVFFRFNNYILDKHIIIIPQEENILSVENFIKFISDLKIKTNILLFDYNIDNTDKLKGYVNKMLKIMDFPNFFSLPYVFATLRFFPHLNKNGVLFLDVINESNKNAIKINDNNNNKIIKEGRDKEIIGINKEINNEKKIKQNLKIFSEIDDINNIYNICDNKYSKENFMEEKILQFYQNFKIGLCLQLNLAKDKSKINADTIGKRNLLKEDSKKKIIKSKNTTSKNSFKTINGNIINQSHSKLNIDAKHISEPNNFSKLYKSKSNLIVNKSAKQENTVEIDDESKYDFTLKYFEINDLHSLNDLLIKKEKLLEFLDYLNFKMFQNKSFILQIPSDFDTKLLIAILYLIIWKLTNVKPMLLKKYIKQNLNSYLENCSEKFAKQTNKNHIHTKFTESLTDEAFSEIADFICENFNVPKAIDSDVEFNFNDFILEENFNEKDFNSNKANSFKSAAYESNFLLYRKKLKSLPIIADDLCDQNYFSLPVPIEKNTQFEENKNAVVYLCDKDNQETNVCEVNLII